MADLIFKQPEIEKKDWCTNIFRQTLMLVASTLMFWPGVFSALTNVPFHTLYKDAMFAFNLFPPECKAQNRKINLELFS